MTKGGRLFDSEGLPPFDMCPLYYRSIAYQKLMPGNPSRCIFERFPPEFPPVFPPVH